MQDKKQANDQAVELDWDNWEDKKEIETEDETYSETDSEETTMNKKAIAYMEKVDGLISTIAELEEQKR